MATEPSIRDALIAEILGDVGKLDDAIKALPASLSSELKPILASIVTEIHNFHKSVKSLVEEDINNFAAKQETLQISFQANAEEILKKNMELAVRDLFQKKATERWLNYVLVFCFSAAGGLLGSFVSNHFLK